MVTAKWLDLLYIWFLECSTYKILNESSRAQSFQRHAGAFVYKKKGWYRFQGEVETKMANSCPKRNHCGWMVGEHPTVDQGVVRRKACFHWSNNCCSFSANIRVRNCGSYYVYELLSNLNYHWKLKLYCGSGLADDTAENSGKHNCSLWNTSTVWRRQKNSSETRQN